MIFKAVVEADAGIFVRRRPFAPRQFAKCKQRSTAALMASFIGKAKRQCEINGFQKDHAICPPGHLKPLLLGTILADR